MTFTRLHRSKFKESYRNDRIGAMRDLCLGIREGVLTMGRSVNIGDLYDAMTDGDFGQCLRSESFSKAFEAADAVGVADFRIATSQFLLHETHQTWDIPNMIADTLSRTRQATTIAGSPPEKVVYWPMPSSNDDDTYLKVQGDQYRRIKMPGAYIEYIGAQPRGAMIEMTRELMLMDKTGGELVQHARNQIKGLRVYREKAFLSQQLGITGLYRFGSHDQAPVSTQAPYLTSGLYVNSQGNTLTDWTSFKSVFLKLSAMKDPVTSQVLDIPTNLDVVVPPALLPLANQILKSINVGQVDNSATTGTIRFYGPNPINDLPFSMTIKSNQFVKEVTGSDTTWYAGDFNTAFANCQVWPFEEREQGAESDASFERDVPYRIRFGYCELPQAYAPFRVIKNT